MRGPRQATVVGIGYSSVSLDTLDGIGVTFTSDGADILELPAGSYRVAVVQ